MPLVAVLASVGCGAVVVDPDCTDELRAGIALTVEDSATGARFPFTDVIAVATERAFRDTARVASITEAGRGLVLGLAHERAGTYAVTVRAAGYAPWTLTGVRVEEEKNVCRHVITRSLVAKLRSQVTP